MVSVTLIIFGGIIGFIMCIYYILKYKTRSNIISIQLSNPNSNQSSPNIPLQGNVIIPVTITPETSNKSIIINVSPTASSVSTPTATLASDLISPRLIPIAAQVNSTRALPV